MVVQCRYLCLVPLDAVLGILICLVSYLARLRTFEGMLPRDSTMQDFVHVTSMELHLKLLNSMFGQ